MKRLYHFAAAAREISPIGAALVFAVAYLAGLAGNLAALLIAAALFIGLYAARFQGSGSGPLSASIVMPEPTPFEQLTAAGLECSRVEFRKPAPARQPKPQPSARA